MVEEPRVKKKRVVTTTQALKLAEKKREKIVSEKPAWNSITTDRKLRDRQRDN